MKYFFTLSIILICLFSANASVIISEIIDPADDFTLRYVEICNVGNTAIDISNYELLKYSNGATVSNCNTPVTNGTVLNSDDCFIFNNANPANTFTNCVNSVNDSGCISGNGNDVYELNDGNNAVDIYGVIGQAGGVWDYQDSRVYRNANVTAPTTNFNLAEWTIEPNALAASATPCILEDGVITNSCTITLNNPQFVCLANTASTDQLTIFMPYSGIDTDASIQILVNNQPVSNTGDDPALVQNGVISFTVFEGDAYIVQFTDNDCNSVIQQGTISSTQCIVVDSGTYYDNVETEVDAGANCSTLKSALHDLIDDHIMIPYTDADSYDVKDFMCTYDMTATGILDRYTNDHLNDNCTGGEFPPGINRDHVVPSSWWGGINTAPQYTDLHNLFPSDASANSAKSNFALGVVGSPTYTSSNGTEVGSDTPNCLASNVFEPINLYKGDFARCFLYMATRYEDVISFWETINNVGDQALTGDAFAVFETCLMDVILQWHINDPVSQLEIDRNNAIFTIQGNRNPFIDHPEYASLIWEVDGCIVNPNPLNTCVADACEFNSVPVITNSSPENVWVCSNGEYTINPFCGSTCDEPTEQWLVSNEFSFTNANMLNFTLFAVEDFNGPDVEIFYSTDYNGGNTAADINAATWNLLTLVADDAFVIIDLMASLTAAERASFYIGIRHTGTGGSSGSNPPGTSAFEISNISIQSDNCDNGCDAQTAEIIGLPEFTPSSSPINLSATPVGGTFSGTGVVFNAFNPVLAGPGNHTISYTYTDENDCTYTASQTILVFTITFNFVNYNLGTINP